MTNQKERGEDKFYYKGKRLSECSREELIEAIHWLHQRMQDDKRIKKMYLELFNHD